MRRTVKGAYERPYVVIFAAAAAMSAHGLYTAAVELGRIPPWLAWSYVLIVDLLAVSAYRTWRAAVEAGRRHWAGLVALGAAVGTVAMNIVAGHPQLAPGWAGPAIAGFPPVAALLAAALRMAEARVEAARTAPGVDESAHRSAHPAPEAAHDHAPAAHGDANRQVNGYAPASAPAARRPAPSAQSHADRGGEGADRASEAALSGGRDRVAALLDAHPDPDSLTGPTVAAATGLSIRRAQELLAQLRAPNSTASATSGTSRT